MENNTVVVKNKYVKKYKCPYCDDRLVKDKLVTHIENKHTELVPQDSCPARVAFNTINHKEHGTCIMCGKETKWNDKTWKYERLCSKECHDKYVKQFKARMKKKYGKEHLLNDAKQQEKMLANRGISGTYKFSDGGVLTYCGTYEQKLLEFFDKVMNVKSKDIMSPGPVIEYTFKGEKHQWITDQYYITANLVFDVKDGGDNPNTRQMDEYRAKQDAKEKAIKEQGKYNYIRLTNNNFEQLLFILAEIKEQMMDPDKSGTVVHVNEEVGGIPPQWANDMNATHPEICSNTFSSDDGAYIVKGKQNGKYTDTYLTTDKYLSKLYKIKDGKVKKINKDDLICNEYTLFKYNKSDYKNKISKILSESKEVADDYFYTVLSEKDTLSENQIDYDDKFIEVIDGYTESLIENSIIESTIDYKFHSVMKSNIELNLMNKKDMDEVNKLISGMSHMDILYNHNGYFAKNLLTNNVSKYFNTISDIDTNTLQILSKMKRV